MHRRQLLLLVSLGPAFAACSDTTSATGPGSLRSAPLNIHPVGPAAERPLQDFLSAQGTFCYPDGSGGCLVFDPPLPNFLWFREPDGPCVAVDYAGVAAAYIAQASGGAIVLPTRIEGTVTEVPQSDGRAVVRVELRASEALTYAFDNCIGGPGTLVFGYSPVEILNGSTPVLGDAVLRAAFVNAAPGAPMPDLLEASFLPHSDAHLISLGITASAAGPLRAAFGVPDGTPGMATVTLVNLPSAGPSDALAAHQVQLRVIGR